MLRFLRFRFRLVPGIVIAVLLVTVFTIQPASAAPSQCSTRFYLSPIRGWQTSDSQIIMYDLSFDPNGVHYKDYRGGWDIVYSAYDPTGQYPVIPWAFIAASEYNHGYYWNSPDLGVMPDYPLNTLLSNLNAKQINEIRMVLTRFGIDTSILETGTYYEDVIWHIGQHLVGPEFNPLNFTFIQQPGTFCWDNAYGTIDRNEK